MEVAKDSHGFSGADLETIVNESAYFSVESGNQLITDADILRAFDKIY